MSINLFYLLRFIFVRICGLRVVASLFVDVSQGAGVQGLYAQSVLGFVRRWSLFRAAIVWKRFAHSEIERARVMEEKGVATGSYSFARKLASSDVKTREKGMGLLVLWLACQQVREA